MKKDGQQFGALRFCMGRGLEHAFLSLCRFVVFPGNYRTCIFTKTGDSL